MLESLRQDPELFRQVRVDAELGTIVWPTEPTWIPMSSKATTRRRSSSDLSPAPGVATTACQYTHVLSDGREVDYRELIAARN
jgi:hypothetical protein